jgi:tetratricopeptide (TPR) repeat protein
MFFSRYILLITAVVFSWSCSTKKNTWVNRKFHNLTSHYNGYWAANEALIEFETNTYNNYKDNYEKILPVFTYTSIDEAKAANGDMEKIYNRASAVIQYHSMLIRDVEYCSWIKNTYVLIGRTHFHKHDYFAGLEAFEYVVNKNKKHPYRFEAMMWMLRTYNETGLFSSAQGLIDLINDEKTFPTKYSSDFNAIVADFYLKQEDYNKGIDFLEIAFKDCKKRKLKARYAYILAQLYSLQGNGMKAFKYYDKTLDYGPGDDMSFNAKLNLATYKAFAEGDPKKAKEMFLDMLDQVKYKDYQDQIYFALAQLCEKEKQIDDEEKYLAESVKVSKANKNQKGKSSLKLGELYLKNAKYELAQAYFDTAVSNLNKDYPNYYSIENKQKSLKTLVGYLQTIATEDSLQKVAGMSEGERAKLIDKLIADKKKKIEEEKKKLEEQKAIQDANKFLQDNTPVNLPGGPGGGPPIGSQTATWYYYNPAALSFGLSEFQKKWGNRKLEDNWRRSTKPMVINTDDPNLNPDSLAANGENPKSEKDDKKVLSQEEQDAQEKESYLKNIPLGSEALNASKAKVIEAYYNCGSLYREELSDLPNAASTFEKLQTKYPDNKYKLVSYYQLYRIYLALPDDALAEKYKNIILTEYAKSEYADIIRNPEYNNEKQASKNKAELYYEETFSLFSNAEYQQTYQRCKSADSLFPKSNLKPKYDLMAAISLGKLNGLNEMLSALKKVVAQYPTDAVKVKAAEMVAILEKNVSSSDIPDSDVKSLFNKEPNEQHYYVMHFPMSISLEDLKSSIANFINDNFSAGGLRVEDLVFNNDRKMIVVKGFENEAKAATFYSLIKDYEEISSQLGKETAVQFIISVNNYNTLLKNQKESESYVKFFQTNYMKS